MSPGATTIAIREADLADSAEGAGLVEVLDSYAREPGGQNAPLPADVRARLIPGLRAHPTALPLLAVSGTRIVGAAVCVWGYSTFAARPLLNIHDFVVLPEFRGQGIGRQLLDDVERRARERGCCKLTLEVHESNEGAKRLYREVGFGPWGTPTLFVSKAL